MCIRDRSLVNHLQHTPVLATQSLYAVEVEGKKVVPIFTSEQDLQAFKDTQDSAKEQTWVKCSSLDILSQLVEAELFGLAFNLKEEGDFSNTTLFASSELIQFINYFTQTLNTVSYTHLVVILLRVNVEAAVIFVSSRSDSPTSTT